jgi:uncharacterized membrane protein YesL
MFRKFLNPDNALMITMTQITDCIFLSLFWLIGCIPVVTIGASFAALYDSTYRGFRQGEKHCWGRFLEVFRGNWKAGILPTGVFLAVLYLLVQLLVSLWNRAVAGAVSWMVFSGGAFVGVLVLGIVSVLFPMLSRFENPLPVLLKNTVFLAMANLPRTLALGILNAAAGLLCAFFVLPLFFLPSLAALIGSVLIEPMFKPYMPSEDAA